MKAWMLQVQRHAKARMLEQALKPSCTTVRLVALALVGICGLLASVSRAQTPQADVIAKDALEQRQYANVVTAYQSFSNVELSDRAQYRLAIAYQKLAQFTLANLAIRRAIELNPKGTFSSSPDRLAVLVASIDEGLTKSSSPSLVVDPKRVALDSIILAVPATPTAAPVEVVSEVSGSTTLAVISPAADALVVKTKSSNSDTSKEILVSQGAPPVPLLPSAANAFPNSTLIFLYALPLLLILTCGFLFQKRKRSASFTAKLESLRDATAQLINELEKAGRLDTQLHAQLTKVLPLLESEAGRSVYRGSGKAMALTVLDKNTVDLMARLEKGPLRIGSASAVEIQAKFFTGNRADCLSKQL